MDSLHIIRMFYYIYIYTYIYIYIYIKTKNTERLLNLASFQITTLFNNDPFLSACNISGENKWQMTLFIKTSFMMKIKIVERERERTALVYTTLRYISREPFVFMLLSKGRLLSSGATWPPLRANAQMSRLVYSADCSLQLTARVENLSLYSFLTPTQSSFWHPTYEIQVAFPLSLVYLKTQLHILFLKSTLTSQSKVNIFLPS